MPGSVTNGTSCIMYGTVRLLVLNEFVSQCTVHGTSSVKAIIAQNAIVIAHCKNTKEKSLKTYAKVWFNKMCRFTKNIDYCNTVLLLYVLTTIV